jgi:hypothetical protein
MTSTSSSRDPIRRLQQRYKEAKKRNFGKGLSLSAFYLRYHSVKDFDELHADVGIEEVYNEEDDDDDDEEEYDEETYLIGKARALLSGPLEQLNRPNDTNWRNIVPNSSMGTNATSQHVPDLVQSKHIDKSLPSATFNDVNNDDESKDNSTHAQRIILQLFPE